MQVDPKVCQIKFDREVANLRRQEGILRGWGCYIIDTTFPKVDLLFLPSKPLVIEAPMWVRQDDQLKLHLARSVSPSVSGTAFGARIIMEDYDIKAPSVTFRDPRSWELAPIASLPIGHFKDPLGKMRPVIIDAHPKFSRPFLCLEGIREFHEHLQHTDQEWFPSRSGFGLFYTAEAVWQTCCINSYPRVIVGTPNCGQEWLPSPPMGP